jgi:hypothetical protein
MDRPTLWRTRGSSAKHYARLGMDLVASLSLASEERILPSGRNPEKKSQVLHSEALI